MNESAFYLHQIDPVAFSVGGFGVYWYSLMYLVAFGAFWLLGRWRARREDSPLTPAQIGDFLFWGVIGVIVGGRLGYVLFYGLDSFLKNPLILFHIREGGMSFHGGLIGVLVAIWLYGRHLGTGFLRLGDFIAPLVPIGLAAGRLGNYIGGELWGRVSSVPWATIFPASLPGGPRSPSMLRQEYLSGALDIYARHPSQLYQLAGEGLALFILLWLFSARPRPVGAVGGAFLAGYAVFRFGVEFFREPDAQLGYVMMGWTTMGQLLSIPMFLVGLALMGWAYGKRS